MHSRASQTDNSNACTLLFTRRQTKSAEKQKKKYFEKPKNIFFVSLQTLHRSLQREVSTTRIEQDKMEFGTEQTHI